MTRLAGRLRMSRGIALSLVATGLAFALQASVVVLLGVNRRADVFFAALVPATTIAAILVSPFLNIAMRVMLDARRAGRDALLPVLAAYSLLAAGGVMLLAAPGADLVAHLLGDAARAEPIAWRYHFGWALLLVPLRGWVTLYQLYAQAVGRPELPKVALIVGRVAGLALLGANHGAVERVAVPALVVSHVVAVGVCGWRLPIRAPGASWHRDVAALLRTWVSISRWGSLLKTDALFDRALAARLAPGFLSLFSLGWNVVQALLEAYQSTAVVTDAREYYRRRADGARPGALSEVLAAYRESTVVGTVFTICSGVLLSGAAAAALWWRGALDPTLQWQAPLLAVALTIAAAALLRQRQYATIFTTEGRALDFIRVLTGVYLVLALPRLGAVAIAGRVGFLAGLVVYHVAQPLSLRWFLARRQPWRQALAVETP